jgi:hypothetical protein
MAGVRLSIRINRCIAMKSALLILLLSSLACAREADYSDDVYRAALMAGYKQVNAKEKASRCIVLSDRTTSYKYDAESIRKALPIAKEETIVNFVEVNNHPIKLTIIKGAPVKCVLIDHTIAENIMHEGSDADFERVLSRYGHPYKTSFLALSRVGFNRQHTEAIIYSESCNRPLAGGSGYALFNRKGKEWVFNSFGGGLLR